LFQENRRRKLLATALLAEISPQIVVDVDRLGKLVDLSAYVGFALLAILPRRLTDQFPIPCH
jgi:hypothetical protein